MDRAPNPPSTIGPLALLLGGCAAVVAGVLILRVETPRASPRAERPSPVRKSDGERNSGAAEPAPLERETGLESEPAIDEVGVEGALVRLRDPSAATRAWAAVELMSASGGRTRALRGIDLRGIDIEEYELENADLAGADLRQAKLFMGKLSGCNFQGANLDGALLRGAELFGANFAGASLASANLRIGKLRGADLSGANLRGADLSGANLREHPTTGKPTDLRGADLRDVEFWGANFFGALYDDQTRFPADFDANRRGLTRASERPGAPR